MKLKRLLLLLPALVLVVSGCGSKGTNDPKGGKTFDAKTMIDIKVRPTSALRTDALDEPDAPGHLSPRQIVREVDYMLLTVKALNDEGKWDHVHRSVSPPQKDVENAIIKMWGNDVVRKIQVGPDDEYSYVLNDIFITARDVYFTRSVDMKDDTIAYIPNKVIRKAEPLIMSAYERGDYEECYRLLQEAYTAIPITGKEYRELIAKGEQ